MAEETRNRNSSVIDTFRNNEAFLILCVQVAIMHIGQGLIAPILPFYAQTFSVSITWVGFLLTSQMLPRIFVNVPAGRLADRWGAHRLLAAAAAIVVVSAIGGGLAPSYFILLLTRLLQGVGTGISQTAGFTYTANVSKPENRARFVSLYQGSFLFGSGIGPIIGGVTAQYFGYRVPFFFYATVAVIVGMWMFFRLPDPRYLEGQAAPRRERPGFIVSIRNMASHPGVMLISLVGLMVGYTRGASRNMAIPLRGGELGLNDAQVGLVLSITLLGTFFALYFVGAFADRFDRKLVLIPALLLTTVTLAGAGLAPNTIVYGGMALFFGVLTGIIVPVPSAYIADVAADDAQGMAIGIFRTLSDGGAVIGPLATGWIIDEASIGTGLLFNGALIALAALAFWVFSPKQQVQELEVSVQS